MNRSSGKKVTQSVSVDGQFSRAVCQTVISDVNGLTVKFADLSCCATVKARLSRAKTALSKEKTPIGYKNVLGEVVKAGQLLVGTLLREAKLFLKGLRKKEMSDSLIIMWGHLRRAESLHKKLLFGEAVAALEPLQLNFRSAVA